MHHHINVPACLLFRKWAQIDVQANNLQSTWKWCILQAICMYLLVLLIFREVFKLRECMLDTWLSCGTTLYGLTVIWTQDCKEWGFPKGSGLEKALSGAVFPLCHMAKLGNHHHLSSELSSCELLGDVNMWFESSFSVASGVWITRLP